MKNITHFGNANNTELRFTEMSVAEVMRWQEEYVNQGNASISLWYDTGWIGEAAAY